MAAVMLFTSESRKPDYERNFFFQCFDLQFWRVLVTSKHTQNKIKASLYLLESQNEKSDKMETNVLSNEDS